MTEQDMMIRQIGEAVEEGRPKDVERQVKKAVELGIPPMRILKESLVPAIQKIGQKYNNDEVYIIKILSSARAMRYGLEALKPYLEKEHSYLSGKMMIGTAEGDLHDMGKNLVALMFETMGFQVVDLGVDVSEKKFVRTLEEHSDVDVICVSSLLTTSMESMKKIVQVLNRYKDRFHFKVMVGGGPVTEEFARKIGADYYTADAYEAAFTARRIVRESAQERRTTT